MLHLTKNYLKKFSTWLLPFTCVLCSNLSQRNQDLCELCYHELPVIKLACPRCGMPMEEARRAAICGQCLAQSGCPFEATYAFYLYQMPIAKLILDLKFNQALVNARVLGELLTEKIQQAYQGKPLPQVIIPVPLHVNRLKERGFNQALEIARPIAKVLKIPLAPRICQRFKPTLAQATLSAADRRQNVKQAFRVVQNFTYSHIAVIDDVITTGSTINEFCQMLKQNGAGKIDVWCCARPSGGT